MSRRNLEPLPSRRAGEGCADFFARVDAMFDAHLAACRDCNYDIECTTCYVQGDHPREAHSCNCTDIDPPGFGVQLRHIREAARRDRDREARGE